MGGFLTDGFSGYNVQEDSEQFLSLEDLSSPMPEVKPRKSRKPLSKNLKPLSDSVLAEETDSMDMRVLAEYSGLTRREIYNYLVKTPIE